MKRIFLLSAAAAMMAAAAPSAFAADDSAVMKRLDQMQKMIEAQQKQIESQKKEIGGLTRALGRRGVAVSAPEPVAAPVPAAPVAPPPVVETRLQKQDQKIDDLVAKFAAERDAQHRATQEQAKASVNNGRLSVTSADGRFSAALQTARPIRCGLFHAERTGPHPVAGPRSFQRRQFHPRPHRASGKVLRRLGLFLQSGLRLGRIGRRRNTRQYPTSLYRI